MNGFSLETYPLPVSKPSYLSEFGVGLLGLVFKISFFLFRPALGFSLLISPKLEIKNPDRSWGSMPVKFEENPSEKGHLMVLIFEESQRPSLYRSSLLSGPY